MSTNRFADDWDMENAVKKQPSKKLPRAVVSVAFSREEFELAKSSAEQLNMKLSEFIRNAALEKANHQSEVTSIVWFGSSEGSFNVSAEFGLLTQSGTPLEYEVAQAS